MARSRLRTLDGRSIHGRMWRDVERELTAALGGDPTPGQTILITQAADMVVRLALLASDSFVGKTSEEHERRAAWWSERLRRVLQALGLESNKGNGKSEHLSDYLHRNYGAKPERA